MKLLKFVKFVVVPIIVIAQLKLVALPFAQGAPSDRAISIGPIGGKRLDFDFNCDLEVEFELIGPNGQKMNVYDLLRDLFGGEIFELELQFDCLEMMNW